MQKSNTYPKKPFKPLKKLKSRLRGWVQWLHLWAALIVGILVLVVCLSGAVALFREPMQPVTHPHLYRVTPGQSVSVDTALKTVQAAYPTRKILEVRVRPNDIYLFDLENEITADYEGVFVDPGTGQINGYLKNSEHLIGWITVLHRALFTTQINLPLLAISAHF